MLTPLSFQKIELSPSYTAVYLGDGAVSFVIYLQAQSGKLIQQWMSGGNSERPVGVDLIESLIVGCELTPLQVVIDDEKEGIFYTKIFLKKEKENAPTEILEIDARPSESLALAILHKLPLYGSENLMGKISNLNEISP